VEAEIGFSDGVYRESAAWLAVESQEVVAVQARAADRRSMVETTMRPVPVVVVKPRLELVIAMLRSRVNTGVNGLMGSPTNRYA
jgi:hypothetical protein